MPCQVFLLVHCSTFDSGAGQTEHMLEMLLKSLTRMMNFSGNNGVRFTVASEALFCNSVLSPRLILQYRTRRLQETQHPGLEGRYPSCPTYASPSSDLTSAWPHLAWTLYQDRSSTLD